MKIIIVGNGGHSKVIQEIIYTIKGYQVIAILDDNYTHMTEKKGIVYGPLVYFENIMQRQAKVIIAIGNNVIRKEVVESLNLRTDQYISVVHPTAVVSKSARIGYGTVVMAGAVINAEAKVGNHNIINTAAIIEHESSLLDFVHVSPNGTLTGNVSIGDGVHIGASATVIPNLIIQEWSVIGAGATVINNVPAYSKAVGCPARLIKSVKGKEKQKIR